MNEFGDKVDPLVKAMRGAALKEARKDERDRTIEECARRVDQMARSVTTDYAVILTAAAEVIRALKK